MKIYQNISEILGSFKVYCWRGMEEINWLDRVKEKVVIHRIKEDTNILHAIKRRKTNWIGHILRRYPEGIIYRREEVTGRRGKSLKQIPGDLKERQNTENWKRKHLIAICGNFSWEGAWDLSSGFGTGECVWIWDLRLSRQWL